MTKPKRITKTVATATAPALIQIIGFRSIMTDHNGDFDLGAVLAGQVKGALS